VVDQLVGGNPIISARSSQRMISDPAGLLIQEKRSCHSAFFKFVLTDPLKFELVCKITSGKNMPAAKIRFTRVLLSSLLSSFLSLFPPQLFEGRPRHTGVGGSIQI
jgi:hypothetical protein